MTPAHATFSVTAVGTSPSPEPHLFLLWLKMKLGPPGKSLGGCWGLARCSPPVSGPAEMGEILRGGPGPRKTPPEQARRWEPGRQPHAAEGAHLSGVSVPAVNGHHTSGAPAHPPETAHMSVRKSTGDSQVRDLFPASGRQGPPFAQPREVSSGWGRHRGPSGYSPVLPTAPAPGESGWYPGPWCLAGIWVLPVNCDWGGAWASVLCWFLLDVEGGLAEVRGS